MVVAVVVDSLLCVCVCVCCTVGREAFDVFLPTIIIVALFRALVFLVSFPFRRESV
jgi:hypothetical protein